MSVRWITAAVVTACLAACSGVTSGHGHREIGASDDQAVSYQGYSGTAIVSTDGRTVTVGPFVPPCFGTTTAVAAQTATRVELWLRDTVPARHGVCQVMKAFADSQQIRLQAPLGTRKLADGATGRAVAWISARLVLRPAEMPAGYLLRSRTPDVDFSGPQSLGPAGCVQLYLDDTRTAEHMLYIEQSAGRLRVPAPGPRGWTAIRIRGQPGLATRNLITWREHGLTDYIAVDGPQWPQVLSTGQLIAIADSAPA